MREKFEMFPSEGTVDAIRGGEAAEAIRDVCDALLERLDPLMMSGRDRSLVITKLQELAFFALRSALARLAAETSEAP